MGEEVSRNLKDYGIFIEFLVNCGLGIGSLGR